MALLLAAGCSAVGGGPSEPVSAESTTLSLPARPRDLRIDGVDPCSLLTEQQRAELGLDGEPLSSTKPSVLFGGDETTCLVRGFAPRAVTVSIGLVTSSGIELFTSNELEADVTKHEVEGFPAVVAVPRRFHDFCSVFIDVAPGNMLDVQYADGGRQPPVPQEQLCGGATQTANAAMQNLLQR
jgi:Protein of unknown function (DUF3558)